jgi:hypothetical protein
MLMLVGIPPQLEEFKTKKQTLASHIAMPNVKVYCDESTMGR